MLEISLIVWGCLILQMLVVWILYRLLKNPSIVDVAWAAGLMMAGLIYLSQAQFNMRICLIAGLLLLWGLRLGGFLWFTRVRKGLVDRRYLKLSENWKIAKSLGFFLNFQVQGFLILIISSVFLFVAYDPAATFSLFDCVGAGLILVAIAGEAVADAELYFFQQNNPGKVCNIGLWNYCRHPNYFFEWLVWCGFALFACRQPLGCLGLLSPFLMYFIMTRMTGPLTERGSLESRGMAYQQYQRTTPMFFPRFKKK